MIHHYLPTYHYYYTLWTTCILITAILRYGSLLPCRTSAACLLAPYLSCLWLACTPLPVRALPDCTCNCTHYLLLPLPTCRVDAPRCLLVLPGTHHLPLPACACTPHHCRAAACHCFYVPLPLDWLVAFSTPAVVDYAGSMRCCYHAYYRTLSVHWDCCTFRVLPTWLMRLPADATRYSDLLTFYTLPSRTHAALPRLFTLRTYHHILLPFARALLQRASIFHAIPPLPFPLHRFTVFHRLFMPAAASGSVHAAKNGRAA